MKLLAMILLLLATFTIAAFTMIFGWGISPQNWYVIIGGYFWTVCHVVLLEVLKKA